MTKFIFSIKEIFSECLLLNEVEGYFIGPYQRGFKWKSANIYDHIPVLLMDLYEAFLKSKQSIGNHEYFLQYITVKRISNDDKYFFEVIDGQQRLTSITLLCNVLEEYFNIYNVTRNNGNFLLKYARYENDTNNIFTTISDLYKNKQVEIDKVAEQDKFYMFHAFKCIYSFFEILKEDREEFVAFLDYLLGNGSNAGKVKIILNKEDEFTSAEEVFANLNANKVPLTNAYLIKGLLLTKASRAITDQQKHFKEIMDERAIMGRTWDEMNSWFSQPEVAAFYFGEEENGMENMLRLVEFESNTAESDILLKFKELLSESEDNNGIGYELFNHFHENIHTAEDSFLCLNRVKHIYKRLRSWYDDNLLYNYLGYFFETNTEKDSFLELKKCLKSQTDELIINLKDHIKSALPNDEAELDALMYGKEKINIQIIKLLLALSVFPEGVKLNIKSTYRYNFFFHKKENWSLEHIFPQNPNLEKFEVGDDKEWVVGKLNSLIKNLAQNTSVTNDDKISELNNTISLINVGKEISTNSIEGIFEEVKDVDNLGNMALLSGKVNSALSNGFFNTKRKILLKKINSGSFVPKHTIDIFSKMLEIPNREDQKELKYFDSTLTVWSDNDIIAHKSWIKQRVIDLRKELSL